jgi:hypothetical protein
MAYVAIKSSRYHSFLNIILERLQVRFSAIMTKFIFLDNTSAAIKCFECSVVVNRRGNMTERLCAKFDESDFFKVNCEFSTMCMKRTYRLKLQNGTWQETFERGCANQKHNFMVKKLIF